MATSPGWKLSGPSRIQIRAPLMVVPSTGISGISSSRIAGEAEGVGERLQPPVVAQHRPAPATNRTTPMRHPDQLAAGEGLRPGPAAGPARSMRWIIARPSPLSAATTGSSTGSAYGATIPDHDVAAQAQQRQPAAVRDDVGGHGALDAEADRGVGADADDQAEDQQEQLGAAPAAMGEGAVRRTPVREAAAHGVLLDAVGWRQRGARAADGLAAALGEGRRSGWTSGWRRRGPCGDGFALALGPARPGWSWRRRWADGLADGDGGRRRRRAHPGQPGQPLHDVVRVGQRGGR